MGGDWAPQDALGEAAARYEWIAEELEAVRHLRDHEVPRSCVHAFAVQGHLHTARRDLDGLAVLQASRSRAE
jgi:hypothetical protein